jgi:aryl-alcohol dehydrogenase-like predicted oxidoreductase
MHYRTLPGTDLEISVVGFGCWAIGGRWWGPVDDNQSERALSHALECGINWFDTAPLYGHGHADEILVRALGTRRREVVIATKFGPRWDQGGEHAVCDLSPANVRRDIEASLSRLELDTIPLAQAHWPCERGTPLEATIAALEELRSEGKLRHYGLCNYRVTDALALQASSSVRSLQKPYSMVRREAEREFDLPADSSLAVLAYETLCRGLLTGKFSRFAPAFPASDMRARDFRFAEPAFSRIQALVSALRTAGARLDVPPAAIAVAWVLSNPAIAAAIVGAKTPAQVGDNVRAADLLGRRKLWQALAPHVDACRI